MKSKYLDNLDRAAADAILDRMIAEKDAEEAAEVVNFTYAELEQEKAFLRTWTGKGKKNLARAGGNFWMAGTNRKRCSIFRPAHLKALVAAGVLVPVGSGYKFQESK